MARLIDNLITMRLASTKTKIEELTNYLSVNCQIIANAFYKLNYPAKWIWFRVRFTIKWQTIRT